VELSSRSCCNDAAYLREQIVSLLNQTFQDFELLIYDDASTDESPLILQEFAVLEILASGPMASDDVYAAARARCISIGTLRLAQQTLKIVPRKIGLTGEHWVWELPVARAPGDF
jgi:glycosyltransferase involved in cell wall biosynthesis